ncbi:MAG: hypothetical protein OEZ48_01500 [Candidatus Bathyarchaeota archaeon]|nr:hypothetical protein [Candidatus Bathyarchaeota archaeon]
MSEDKWNYGICGGCGNVVRRKSPADLAICEYCYESDPRAVTEVALDMKALIVPARLHGKLKTAAEQFEVTPDDLAAVIFGRIGNCPLIAEAVRALESGLKRGERKR